MWIIFLLYALLAATFTIGKALLLFVPPIFLIGFRMLLAGLFLLCIQAFVGSLKIKRIQDFLFFIGLSVIYIFIPYVFEYLALDHMTPSCAALIYNLSPFFSALFSYCFFDEKMTLKKWIGFLIGFGAIIFFLNSLNLRFSCWHTHQPYFILLVSVISGALGWMYIRKMMMNESEYSLLFINGWTMFLGGIESLLISRWYEGSVSLPWGNMMPFMLLLCAIILVSNIIFYHLYGYLLKRYTATLLSFIGFVTPFFVALYDWLFLGIYVGLGFFVAIIILGFGIYLFYQEELKQGYVLK